MAGLAAFLKTAHLEHPKLYGQVIQADPDESASSLLAKLKENRAHPEQAEIRYEAANVSSETGVICRRLKAAPFRGKTKGSTSSPGERAASA
ncbi:hypothetical protein [Bacillus velezensis]|uniref:hypothetical protein n=1 Tax=Bacillus velezensis TaxID=492670 RepID=UPI0023E87FFC|nr:hypothetical protein [Bacillus velezensis]